MNREYFNHTILGKYLPAVVIVVLVVAYIVASGGHKAKEPSINIDGLAKAEVFVIEEGSIQSDGLRVGSREYVLYTVINTDPSDVETLILEHIDTGAIVAYSVRGDDLLHIYYTALRGFAADDWLAAFYDNGRGSLDKNNIYCIYKARDVSDVPQWIEDFKK